MPFPATCPFRMYRISSHEWRIVALGCSGHIHGNAEPDDASNGVGSADFGLVVILASSHASGCTAQFSIPRFLFSDCCCERASRSLVHCVASARSPSSVTRQSGTVCPSEVLRKFGTFGTSIVILTWIVFMFCMSLNNTVH